MIFTGVRELRAQWQTVYSFFSRPMMPRRCGDFIPFMGCFVSASGDFQFMNDLRRHSTSTRARAQSYGRGGRKRPPRARNVKISGPVFSQVSGLM